MKTLKHRRWYTLDGRPAKLYRTFVSTVSFVELLEEPINGSNFRYVCTAHRFGIERKSTGLVLLKSDRKKTSGIPKARLVAFVGLTCDSTMKHLSTLDFCRAGFQAIAQRYHVAGFEPVPNLSGPPIQV